jgi:flagellar motor switch protein FliM
MDSVPVTLSVELGTTAMSVRDVLALQPGQVLKLSRHRTEELPVKVEGVPKFFGMPVHEDGAIGIEITRKR